MVGDRQLPGNERQRNSENRNGNLAVYAGGERMEDEADALRWREAILKLSRNLMEASAKRSELSPFLMEAMHSALDNLLVHGREDDLLVLEEWLEHEASLSQ